MEMYIEKGESRIDCEMKIAEKYKRPFQIYEVKEISIGGFMGLFTKPGVQVKFAFSSSARPRNPITSTQMFASQTGIRFMQDSAEAQEEEKRKILAIAANTTGSNEYYRAVQNEAIIKNKPAANNAAINNAAYNKGAENSEELLNTLKGLLEKVENIGADGKKEEHPSFGRIEKILKLNDFSETYINKIIERMRKEMVFDQLNDFDIVQENVIEWIGESISIFNDEPSKENRYQPRIMVLIGPTGVGKTTTIAKLAAIFGIESDEVPALNVKMITIDAFRIGAKEQLEKMGDIMQIPVSCVVNRQELRKEIALQSEGTDLFLIDTIGKSPKEAAKLGEMKEILEGLGRSAEYHLVIGASTRTSDIEKIFQQFEPFNYKSVILTKTDETDHYGNIISALAEKRKSLSYLTCGQTVPVDIKRASVVNFLINIEGFKVDREKIEQRFPSGNADQFKWK